ncbi:MAG TPA: precorrin-2 C(20)-methyltransferase [Candidatus Ornithomonoglobus merdipullorum]|uniref:Precorrin-2 C(20)-methyltransferase n=1 Tax=Candidatus Ornithomonoglobus merdipullorum TaxID=2840895 RepID=A0A9D1MDZ4_9FIRM|nr:precorrin-2 C(20)-methyltransferase [Candidatus Ornithomonoglobus merdipullorum]
MRKGKLYGVGVGPGDKELLTLKALRVLKEADIIASPVTKGGGKAAYDIVSEYIKDKKVIEFVMPMSKDHSELRKNYEETANMIAGYLDKGADIAFITLGDVTVYSTYMKVNEIVKDMGFETELIPGITSFCAAAARLNTALCERNEPLVIMPASYELSADLMLLPGTKVFMKAGREADRLCDILRDCGCDAKVYMAERCGMEGERFAYNLEEINMPVGYFTLFIVKQHMAEE